MAVEERKPRAVSVREDTYQLIRRISEHCGCNYAAIVRRAVEMLAHMELPDNPRKETR